MSGYGRPKPQFKAISKTQPGDGVKTLRFYTEPGTHRNVLRLFDKRHGTYDIPLGDAPSRPKQTPSDGKNAAVHVLPVRYLSSRNDPHEVSLLRRGWLYIYCNGKLWRELHIADFSILKDVNLNACRGKDVRPATAGGGVDLFVPVRSAGVDQKIEMAYSEVQWNWAYITKLETDSALRRKRMQTIPLGKGFPQYLPSASTAQVEHVRHTVAKDLAPHRLRTDLVAVYLHDPLGEARTLDEKLDLLVDDLLCIQAVAMAEPKYVMAETAHQIVLQEPSLQKHVDLKEIRNVLHWDELQKAQEKIQTGIGELLACIEKDDFTDADQGISVATAMDDYFARHDAEYLAGIDLVADLFDYLQSEPGQKGLLRLFGGHRLIKRLTYPTPAQKAMMVKDKLNTVAKFIEILAGAAAGQQTVRDVLLELTQHLVLAATHERYTLKVQTVQIDPKARVTNNNRGGFLHHAYFFESHEQISARLWVVTAVTATAGTERTVPLPMSRPVQWLTDNHPLVKAGALRFFMAIETVNLGKAVCDYRKEAGGKNLTAIAGVSSSLISTGLEYFKDVKKKWDVSHLQVGSTAHRQLYAKRVGLVVGTHGLAFLGNAVTVWLGITEARDQWGRGDRSAAAAAGVTGFGQTIVTVASAVGGAVELRDLRAAQRVFANRLVSRTLALGAARSATVTRFLGVNLARFAVLNWIGLAVSIAGIIWSYFTYKTPLQEWLIYGPFAADAAKRFLPEVRKGKKQWESWKHDLKAEADLFTLLHGFVVEPTFMRGSGLRVKLTFPFVLEGQSRVDWGLYGSTRNNDSKLIRKGSVEAGNDTEKGHALFLHYPYEQLQGLLTFQFRAYFDLRGDGSEVYPLQVDDNGCKLPQRPMVVDIGVGLYGK